MKRKNLCNSCNNQKINWCDELKEHAMRGFYDCEWYSEKEEQDERCDKCLFSKLKNDTLECGLTGGTVKSDWSCLTFKPIEHNPDKEKYNESKVYIDPLVTKDEMASITAEIKSESYPKLSRLIQYLMEEYLVEDIQIERVFEAGEDFYRAKLKYKEFPF